MQAAIVHYRQPVVDGRTAIACVEPDSAASVHASLAAGEPVTVPTGLTSMMGLEVWLVTGYEEAREVLGNVHHSTDISPYMGASGDVEKGDIGGLGFTDPPEHTPLRREGE